MRGLSTGQAALLLRDLGGESESARRSTTTGYGRGRLQRTFMDSLAADALASNARAR